MRGEGSRVCIVSEVLGRRGGERGGEGKDLCNAMYCVFNDHELKASCSSSSAAATASLIQQEVISASTCVSVAVSDVPVPGLLSSRSVTESDLPFDGGGGSPC